MDFKNVPLNYRPIPFWSWNEKLNPEETARQVRLMYDAGIGGFFMHARGGLETPYLSEEWFDNVEAAIAQAEKLGMRPWAYDENGWPSGFGDGIVNGLGVEYQQKYLRVEDVCTHPETHICDCGEHSFYYEINPFYVDTLDEKVTKKFIEVAYAPYYARFGNRIEGFFTDEPQISRDGIPWSFVFEKEYKDRYGLDILQELESLFFPVGDYKNVRIRFWKMVTELFSAAYMKQIYDWCDARGLKLTGHLVSEETPTVQVATNGACMPHYEYFHLPGMDWLSRKVPARELTTLQLRSACAQLGKKEIMSETFAGTGHNVSFDELKGIYQRHMVMGVNLLCPHLEGYSIRGLRKRDWPAAMYYQQPWWEEYAHWVDAMSRIGMVVRESCDQPEVLLLHPQTTAWTLFDSGKNPGLQEMQTRFFDITEELKRKHINFHLGDETLMERHGRVENGKLIIGNCSYDTVIDECSSVLLDHTKALLAEFKAQGGKVMRVEDVAAASFMEENAVVCTHRVLEGQDIYYFVNTTAEPITAQIRLQGNVMDIYTGELTPFAGAHTFEPHGSLLLFAADVPYAAQKQTTKAVLGEVFRVDPATENAMTLDFCDYYFDGVLQQKEGYVLDITNRACELERPVNIRQEFFVQAKAVPEKLYLVMETPDQFTLSVNGRLVEKQDLGPWFDPSFRKIDISGLFTVGQNVITLECNFKQSPEIYENIRKSYVFESEKNKLRYDMEIEPIYLLGSFGVNTPGAWGIEMERKSAFYAGRFVMDKLPETVNLNHIERQGFPFFCGKLELEGKVTVAGENPVLQVNRKGVNVLHLEAENVAQTLITGTDMDLTGLSVGEHRVKLTLTNNLRNLLGPHHYWTCEPLGTSPAQFQCQSSVWAPNAPLYWVRPYGFAEMSL